MVVSRPCEDTTFWVITPGRQKCYFLSGNNPSCISHLPLLTAMLKAEPTADQAAPRAQGTRGSGASVGAMQNSSALGTDRLSLRSTGEVLTKLSTGEQLRTWPYFKLFK